MFSSVLTLLNGMLLAAALNEDPDMRSFLDFLLAPCKCKCGVPNREGRFVGGELLRGYEFPWLGIVHVPGRRGELRQESVLNEANKPEDFPGFAQSTFPATLINDRYLLTGASPLQGLTPYDVKVTLGQFDRCASDVSSTNVSVAKILLHPDFSQENKAHDLALIQLTRPIPLERRISPVCLSFPGHDYLGQVATIVSWPTESSCRPRKLGLPVLDKDKCLQTVPKDGDFSADKGCVGLFGAPSVVCSEDAGTPVLYRSLGGVYDLIGVLTDQNSCRGNSRSTGLYTKVNDHLTWIKKNTRDACYCIKT